jgi:hypothetical protein
VTREPTSPLQKAQVTSPVPQRAVAPQTTKPAPGGPVEVTFAQSPAPKPVRAASKYVPLSPLTDTAAGQPDPANPANAVNEEPAIPLPVARFALSYVGMDPDADEVWAAAINDPRLPPDARKDLIEDLNEDGFPDPKNLTADDLPLIVSRLALIEELAPDAADEVNAEAFAEAYKDLLNMFLRAAEQ